MRISDIDFPRELIDALRDNTLVVFAGAGVSRGEPACLPGFESLADEIASGTGEQRQSSETVDRFLGRLQQERETKVHTLAAEALARDGLEANAIHSDLLRLFTRDQSVRLVTTNFDELFEQAAETEGLFDPLPEVFRAPALPLGHDFSGIVHVHGAVSRPQEMVLTDGDFGRAYLTEGWARRFLVPLFRKYTVLFVGYSHSDTDMLYLARALPTQEARRFALIRCDSDQVQRWKSLGVEPIIYPQTGSDGHNALYEGVRRLADCVRRGVLEWKNVIKEIARSTPAVNKEDADIVEEALRDEVKTRFFTEHASSPEWINWLDERQHLEALFRIENTLNEREGVLSWWLAREYACRSADKLFLLIGRHNLRLHPHFWSQLVGQVSQSEAVALNANDLSRWVSVLLATAPPNANLSYTGLSNLGMRCAEQQDFSSLVQVFEAMTASRLTLEPGFSWPEGEEAPINASSPIASESFCLWRLWEKTLKPHLDRVADPLLKVAIRRLFEHYQSSCSWQKANRNWDLVSWGRSAIEPHEQDSYREPIDVLIDVARDCLEWLAENQENAASRWCEQLIADDAPLLRRLAVHTISARADLSADQKVDWILAQDVLRDLPAHHEVFQAAKHAYPAASSGQRSALIAAVRACRWKNDDESDVDKYNAYHQLNWFKWLHDAAPDCPLAQNALDSVSQMLPGYEPRKYPDLLSYSEVSDGPNSPWTTGELLSKPADKWLSSLLSFQPEEMQRLELSRYELLGKVTEAARQQFDWGIELAKALTRNGEWDADLWRSLMNAWQDMELSEDQYGRILCCLNRIELFEGHALEIASILFTLVQNEGKPYALSLFSRARVLANAVWRSLSGDEVAETNDRVIDGTINHPAGRLTLFWLHGLALWRNSLHPTPTELNDEFRSALSEIVESSALPGRLGRSLLASQLAFLLAADESWTRCNLLPLFALNNEDFYVAWDGFLTLGRLTPAVAELLEKAFLEAIQPLTSVEFGQREKFIGYYTTMLAYFVENPLEDWIPRLFHTGQENVGAILTSSISDHLRGLNEAMQMEWWQGWLREYWQKRLEGVPATLAPDEVARMLHWPALLTAVFPEAVELAVKLNPTPLEHGWMIDELNRNDMLRHHPEEVAQLLLHFEKFDLPGYLWYDAPPLINKLLATNVPEDLKLRLRELKARQGFED